MGVFSVKKLVQICCKNINVFTFFCEVNKLFEICFHLRKVCLKMTIFSIVENAQYDRKM